jgi:hypothetical protein
MADLGKMILVFGGVLVLLGLMLTLFGRAHIPLGRLPGDFLFRGKNTTVYFPLATSILLSLLLNVVLYVIGKFRR